MSAVLEYLKEFTFGSVVLRLVLAALAGGLIGAGRSRKQRAAGICTHMLTSIGAAMTILIGMYDYEMLHGQWADIVAIVGERIDVTRYAAQVISGIGFLAAGTIITVAHQQKEGLTTATGLFASVCMGMAAGAGFYEVVVISVFLIIFILDLMPPEEMTFKRRVRGMTVFVEFTAMEDVSYISKVIRARNSQIYEIDMERTHGDGVNKHPSAIFTMKLGKNNASHSEMLSSIAKLPCVYSIQELIA